MSPLYVTGTLILSLLASTVTSHYVKGGEIDISQNTVAGTNHGYSSSSSFSSAGSYSQSSSGSFQTSHVAGPIPAGVVRTQFANHPPVVHSGSISGSSVGISGGQGHHASVSSGISSASVKSKVPLIGQYWWMEQNSPFTLAYEMYKNCKPGVKCIVPHYTPQNIIPNNGCNINGCGLSGSFNLNDVQSGSQHKYVSTGPIDASRNPYLSGEITVANLGPIPGCSGTSCSTETKTHHFSSTEIKPVNVAGNPYLNGEYKSGHIAGIAGSYNQQYELGTGASQQIDVAKNPFLSGKVTGTQTQIPHQGSPGCGNAPDGSCLGTASVSFSKKPIDANNNPFLNKNYKTESSGHVQQSSTAHAQQSGASQKIDVGNNPFLTGNIPSFQGHNTPQSGSGCNGAPGGTCSGGSTTFTGNNKQEGSLVHGQVSSSQGHFSQISGGQTSSGGSGCTGAPGSPCPGSGSTLIIGSNNPFLSGQVPPTQGQFGSQQPSGGHPSSPTSGCNGAPGSSCSGTGNTFTNNPFLNGQRPSSQGCDGKPGSTCSNGGVITLVPGQNNQLSGGHVSTSHGTNQLGGQSGPGCSGSPGSPGCSGSSTVISNNPFLNGQVPPTQGQIPHQPYEQGCGGLPGSPCTGSGPNKPISGGPINIGSNPFLNNNKPNQNQNVGSIHQQQQHQQQQQFINAGSNPFLSGQKPNKPQPIPTIIPGQSNQGPQPIPDHYPGQQQQKPIASQFPGHPQPIPSTYPGQPTSKGASCSGVGYICIAKEKCINGVVDKYGEGLMQVRTSIQYCNVNTEVCCRLPNGPGTTLSFSSETQYKTDSQSSGSHSSSGFFSTNGNEITQETVGSPVRSPFNVLTPGSQISSGIINVPPKTNGGLIHIAPGPSPTFISPSELAGGRVELPPGSKQGPAYIPPEPTPIQPKPSIPGYEYSTTTTYRPQTISSTIPPYRPSIAQPQDKPSTQPTYTPSGSAFYPETSYLPPIPDSSKIVSITPPTTPKYISSTYTPSASTTPGVPYLPPDNGEIIKDVYLTTPKPDHEPNYTGGPSEKVPNFVRPPTQKPPVTSSTRPPISPPIVPPTEPHAGCAAALKCVSIDHCTAEGVISETVVHLTREQHELRVPLTDCKDIDSGFVGKCCRDPNYKDPWPAGQLGLWNPNNGFDDGSYKSDKSTNGRYKPTNNNRPNFNGQVNLPTFIPGNEGRVPSNINNVPGRQIPGLSPGGQIPGRVPGGQIPGLTPGGQIPGLTPGGQIPGRVPGGQIPGLTPGGQIPGRVPGGQIPGLTPGGQIPGLSPGGQIPGLSPGGQIPGLSPGGQIPGRVPVGQIPGRVPVDQSPGRIPNIIGQGSNLFNVGRPYEPLPSATGTCGVRRYDSTPKGIGPLDANFGEIPWQAMILRDTNRSLLCGGAIIRPDVVITSAHCLEGLPVNDILVKGGEWRLGIDEEPKPFQIIKLLTIVTHPEYDSRTLVNDVAILFLAEKFRLDRHIDTICLPPENEIIEVTYGTANCITTGWGKEVLRIHIQNSLPHRIGINLLPPPQCKSTLSTNYASQLYQYNPKSCVCGTPSVPNNDICDVDQGSALACDLGDGHYRLTGIYSWDTGCQVPGSTQIASFVRLDIPWINLVLGTPVQQFLQQSGSAVPGYRVPPPVKGGRPQIQQTIPQTNYYQTQQQQQHQQHINSGVPCECEGK